MATNSIYIESLLRRGDANSTIESELSRAVENIVKRRLPNRLGRGMSWRLYSSTISGHRFVILVCGSSGITSCTSRAHVLPRFTFHPPSNIYTESSRCKFVLGIELESIWILSKLIPNRFQINPRGVNLVYSIQTLYRCVSVRGEGAGVVCLV